MKKALTNLPNVLAFIMTGVALCGSVYGVNSFNKLAICSPFFIFSLSTVLILAHKFNWKAMWGAALISLALNILISMHSLQWMHIFSFIGILGAIYGSTQVFSALKSTTSMPVRVCMSLAAGVLMDAIAMLPWEIYMFTLPRFVDVLFKSFFYKFSYVSLVGVALLSIYSYKSKNKVASAIN